MKRGYIDRFEGDLAVIEVDGTTIDVPRTRLPADMKAGDAVIFEDGDVRPDREATERRKREIEALMDELFE